MTVLPWVLAILGLITSITLFGVILVSSNKTAQVYAENNVLRMALSDKMEKSWLERQKAEVDALIAKTFPERATEPSEEPVAIAPEPVEVDEQQTLVADNKKTIRAHMRNMGFSDDQIRRVTGG